MPTQLNSFVFETGPQAYKVFLQPLVTDLEASDNDVYMMTGVKGPTPMGYMSRPNSILQSGVGCSLEPTQLAALSNRLINPERAGFMPTLCADWVEQTALQRFMAAGNDSKDFEQMKGVAIREALLELVRGALKQDFEKILFWGNKKSAELPYKLVDGIWARIIAFSDDNAAPYIDTGSGAPLAAGEALEIFRRMYEAQSNALDGLPAEQKRFYASRKLVEAYRKDLQALTGQSSLALSAVAGGQIPLMFEDIEIKKMSTWEQEASKHYGTDNPHFAILSARQNFVFATDGMAKPEDLSLEIFRDRMSNTWVVRGHFMAAFDVAQPELMVVGY